MQLRFLKLVETLLNSAFKDVDTALDSKHNTN